MKITTVKGQTPLAQILAQTKLTLRPGEFVLIGLEPDQRPQVEADLVNLNGDFWQYLVEPDVLTLLLKDDDWAHLEPRYPYAKIAGPFCIFTFSVAMDWDVVGFLAAVTNVLARVGVPLGAVCGYYRDHLFISVELAGRAEAVLQAEIERARQQAP
ncbi:MAG: hypothetical protein JW953_09545 [Anaerolineae bacterium]|nr:hypothetical protein [Anaerolineae bacterium]